MLVQRQFPSSLDRGKGLGARASWQEEAQRWEEQEIIPGRDGLTAPSRGVAGKGKWDGKTFTAGEEKKLKE